MTRRTVSFLRDNLHNLARADGQLVRAVAAKVVQNLGCGLLRGRGCGWWRRWRSFHRASRLGAGVCGCGGGHGLRNNPRLGSSCGLGRLRQGLCGRYRPASCSRELRGAAAWAAGTEEFALGNGSGSNLFGPRSRFRYEIWRFARAGVDRTTLVAVDPPSLRILDCLDCGQLAGLLVVLNAIPC